MTLRRFASRVAVGICIGLFFIALRAAGVGAATYTTSCPSAPADPTCDALAERLEAQVSELEAQTALLTTIETNTAGNGPAEIAGTVALSAGDRERLDLGWWGAWATVGLLLVLMIAPPFLSVMRVTRGMVDGRG